MKAIAAALAAGLLLALPIPSHGADSPAAPDADPAFHRLDFWVGNWKVYDAASGKLDGTNRIEKILRGCALLENWTEADGSGAGKSLFYYNPATGAWKQVWVTDAGTCKEKQLVAGPAGGAVRFQGEVALRRGGTVLDRTTLTPLPDGRVEQTIEISRDRGTTWQTAYDAYYVRAPDDGGAAGKSLLY
jgi:hypothetical protein